MRSLTPFQTPFYQTAPLPTFRKNTLLLAILGILFSIPSSAQPTPYYKLVTSSNELVPGEQYIICIDNQDPNEIWYMDNSNISGNYMRSSKISSSTLYNSMVPQNSATLTFTLEKNEDNTWNLLTGENSYLKSNSGSSSSANFSIGEIDSYSSFTIDIQEETHFAVIRNKKNSKQVLYYKGDIKCYTPATDKSSIFLYKHNSDIYTRQRSTKNFGTICIPFDVISPNETGASYYNIIGKKIVDGEPTGIYLEQTNRLEAGVPYIYKFTSEWLAIPYQKPTVTEAKEAMGLVGNLSQSTKYVPQNAYVLSEDKLWKVAGDEYRATIKPNRAYITIDHLPEYGETQSKAVFFPVAYTSTGINMQTKDSRKGEEKFFTITGQEIKGLHKGIIISRRGKILVR